MTTQDIISPYEPRPLQMEIHQALYNEGHRIRNACLAIHRRFGKTVFAINELVAASVSCPLPNPRCFYIAPTFKQAKSIAWDYLKDFTRVIPGMKFYETELKADFPNGARIQLSGAENFEAIRGNYIDAVVLDEWGNMNPQVWREVLRPAMADRKGWVIFLGTPNGKNHFFDTYQEARREPDWLARTYSVDETKLIDQKELDAARRTMGEEEYRQEFLCDWSAAVRGSFYGNDISLAKEQGRVLTIPPAPTLPVDVAFDLGMDDATAVWFVQSVVNEIRLIDYQEWTNTSLIEVFRDMSRLPYRYGECFMPHDAAVRELITGRTRKEAAESTEMFESVTVTRQLKIADGINAVRMLLPQCFFEKDKCEKGVDALDNYRKKHDPRTNTYLETPVHDKYSHGADAFRTLAINYHPMMGDLTRRNIDNITRQSQGRKGAMSRPGIIRTGQKHRRVA